MIVKLNYFPVIKRKHLPVKRLPKDKKTQQNTEVPNVLKSTTLAWF